MGDLRGNVYFHLMVFLTILLAVVLFSTNITGISITDEVAYIATVDSLYKTGSLYLWNGNNEYVSNHLLFPSTKYYFTGDYYHIYAIPAPLYAFLALPFYGFFGLDTLIYLNIVFYCLLGVLVFFLAKLVTGDDKLAFYAFVVSTFVSYTLQYARVSIPHMPAAFLLVLSVYLILFSRIREKDSRLIFYAGFLLALSVGFRYPNAILIPVFAFFIHRGYKVRDTILFFAGCFLGLLPTLVLHKIYVESILLTGYGNVFGIFLTRFGLLPLLVLLILGFLVVGILIRGNLKGGDYRKIVSVFCLVFLVLFLTNSVFREFVVFRSNLFYSKVFDLSFLDYDVYRSDVLDKRSLFQASPYIILGFLAFFKKNSVVKKDVVGFLLSIVLVLILFYSIVFKGAGGINESYGVRYFIDVLPLLTVLAVFTVSDWVSNLRLGYLDFFVFLFLVCCLFLFFSEGLVYPGSSVFRFVPLVFSLGLLLSFVLNRDDLSSSKAFTLFLVLCLSLGFAFTIKDTINMNNRKYRAFVAWEALESVIEEDSLLVVDNKARFAYVLRPFLDLRDIRITKTVCSACFNPEDVLSFYASKNKTIYLLYFDEITGEKWVSDVNRMAIDLDYDRIFWLNLTVSEKNRGLEGD